jgi:hypothetical protein
MPGGVSDLVGHRGQCAGTPWGGRMALVYRYIHIHMHTT